MQKTRAIGRSDMLFEEYAIPAFLITFTLGVLLGINLGMLCIPRFFEPAGSCSSAAQSFLMKPQPSPPIQTINPLRYPSGFTSKQLQQHDFVPSRRSQPQPLGANIRRPLSSFNY